VPIFCGAFALKPAASQKAQTSPRLSPKMAGDASGPTAIERVMAAAAAGVQASCYGVLDIAASAAAGDIRRAYLSLALQVRAAW